MRSLREKSRMRRAGHGDEWPIDSSEGVLSNFRGRNEIANKYRLLILGAGNPLMKDDGIGVYIAHELEKMGMPKGVKVIDVGTSGFTLFDLMSEAPKVVLLDAVEMGKKPGTVKILTPRDLIADADKIGFSLHDIGLPQVLQLASLQGISQEVVIIGIQPKDLKWGIGLSPELQQKVPHIVEYVLSEMKKDI